MVMVMPSID